MKKMVSVVLAFFLIFQASFSTVAASVSDEVIENNVENVIVDEEYIDEEDTDSSTEEIENSEAVSDATEEITEESTTESTTEENIIIDDCDTEDDPEDGTLEEESSEELNEEEQLLQASGQLVVATVDKDSGHYRICLGKEGVDGKYNSYKVAVWSDNNGKDDLKWYDMVLKQDGSYVHHLQLLEHFAEYGLYNVHVYGCTDNKPAKLVAKTSFQASEIKKNEIVVTPSADKRYYTVVIKNLVVAGKNYEEISQIMMPTWSEKNGQDDIIWENATKVNRYTWKYVVDIKKHISDIGVYNTHVYAKVNDQSIFVGKKSYKVEGIDGTKASINISYTNSKDGIYGIKAKGFSSPTTIISARAAIWSDKNGRDDLKWEQLTGHKDGTFTYNVDISDHNYDTGTYVVQIYVKDSRGVEQCVKTKKWTVTQMTRKNVIKVDVSSNQSLLTIKLMNASTGMNNVFFPVWGDEKGQNDIVWYQATKVDTRTWTVQVPISNHKEAGLYQIHCYKEVNGARTMIGKTTCKINGFYATTSAVARDNKKGYIRISATGVNSPAGVAELKAAVWTEKNGRDDIRWYSFEKKGTEWIAVADVSYHNGEKGKYNIHVWGTDKRGISQCIKTTTTEVTTINAMPNVSASIQSDEVSYLLKARSIIGATSVRFAVWGNENGQNDLRWYSGSRLDGRTWTTTVDMFNHLESGLYNVHVYAVINGVEKIMCTTAFNFTGNPVELRLRRDCENVYNMVGRDLKACFDYVVNSMTYERINGHLTPPAGWTRCQNYAIKALETHRGNCFCYAAAFYYLAKFLGYNAEYVEGQVPSRRGGYTPHGWVVIDGAYICDTEGQAEIARNLNCAPSQGQLT